MLLVPGEVAGSADCGDLTRDTGLCGSNSLVMELTGLVRRVSRHQILFLLLLLLWVTVSVLDFYSAEDYGDVYEGNKSLPLPESLNIPGVSISNQSFPEDDQTQSGNDDLDFESWMSRQSELKENIRKVCDKYGKSLNRQVPLNQFIYDSKHKLLFCRNAKVNYSKLKNYIYTGCHVS